MHLTNRNRHQVLNPRSCLTNAVAVMFKHSHADFISGPTGRSAATCGWSLFFPIPIPHKG